MVRNLLEPAGPTFFDLVGGEPTFRKLVDEFYAGVATDPVLRPLYPEEDLGPASERLRLPFDLVVTASDELIGAGLLAADADRVRFAPTTEPAAVVALCRTYDADRLLVLREMTALAMDRIRNSAARAFSDAFRIRRRDGGRGGSDA